MCMSLTSSRECPAGARVCLRGSRREVIADLLVRPADASNGKAENRAGLWFRAPERPARLAKSLVVPDAVESESRELAAGDLCRTRANQTRTCVRVLFHAPASSRFRNQIDPTPRTGCVHRRAHTGARTAFRTPARAARACTARCVPVAVAFSALPFEDMVRASSITSRWRPPSRQTRTRVLTHSGRHRRTGRRGAATLSKNVRIELTNPGTTLLSRNPLATANSPSMVTTTYSATARGFTDRRT